jgi:hypothetical protein
MLAIRRASAPPPPPAGPKLDPAFVDSVNVESDLLAVDVGQFVQASAQTYFNDGIPGMMATCSVVSITLTAV